MSDGVAFAYLADAFVLPSAQGAGVGKALVAADATAMVRPGEIAAS